MGFRAPWSDLPQELLSAIIDRLNPTGTDIHRFRAVCKSWRLSLPHPTSLLSLSLPHKLPPPPGSPTFYADIFWGSSGYSYVLTAAAVFLLHPRLTPSSSIESDSEQLPLPLRGWLLFADELNPGILYARYPLSKNTIGHLPYNFPDKINMFDFNVTRIGLYSSLCLAKYKPGREDDGVWEKNNEWNGLFDKSIMFRDRNGVLVLFNRGKLGFMRFGDTATECHLVHDGKGFKIDDILEHKGIIYGVNRRGRCYVVDYQSLELRLISGPISRGGGWRKRLVVSCGELYLVVRVAVSADEWMWARFKVYKLVEKEHKWDEVRNLGDQIFFFGLDFAFSVSAHDLRGSCEANHILYIRGSFRKYNGHEEELLLFENPHLKEFDIGSFRLNDYGNDSSYFGNFEVLWPPPPWVMTVSLSELTGALKIALKKLRSDLQYEQSQVPSYSRYSKGLRERIIQNINARLRRHKRKFSSMYVDNHFRASKYAIEIRKNVADWKSRMQESGHDLARMLEGISSFDDLIKEQETSVLPPELQKKIAESFEYLKVSIEAKDLLENFKHHLLS